MVVFVACDLCGANRCIRTGGGPSLWSTWHVPAEHFAEQVSTRRAWQLVCGSDVLPGCHGGSLWRTAAIGTVVCVHSCPCPFRFNVWRYFCQRGKALAWGQGLRNVPGMYRWAHGSSRFVGGRVCCNGSASGPTILVQPGQSGKEDPGQQWSGYFCIVREFISEFFIQRLQRP